MIMFISTASIQLNTERNSSELQLHRLVVIIQISADFWIFFLATKKQFNNFCPEIQLFFV